jgi:DNA-binding NarL/FixJ family response regulator
MTDRTITLIVVDDHPVVRDGLRGMFDSAPDFEVLGEARTASRRWSWPAA